MYVCVAGCFNSVTQPSSEELLCFLANTYFLKMKRFPFPFFPPAFFRRSFLTELEIKIRFTRAASRDGQDTPTSRWFTVINIKPLLERSSFPVLFFLAVQWHRLACFSPTLSRGWSCAPCLQRVSLVLGSKRARARPSATRFSRVEVRSGRHLSDCCQN